MYYNYHNYKVVYSYSHYDENVHFIIVVTYDYDGSAFSITYKEEGIGQVLMMMVWEPELEQYMIKQLNLFLSLDFINHWFRTSY